MNPNSIFQNESEQAVCPDTLYDLFKLGLTLKHDPDAKKNAAEAIAFAKAAGESWLLAVAAMYPNGIPEPEENPRKANLDALIDHLVEDGLPFIKSISNGSPAFPVTPFSDNPELSEEDKAKRSEWAAKQAELSQQVYRYSLAQWFFVGFIINNKGDSGVSQMQFLVERVQGAVSAFMEAFPLPGNTTH